MKKRGKMLTNAQLNYLHYKEKGICVQCGQWDASPGKVRCEVCLLQNSESQAKKMKKESEQEKKERQRKHREYLKKLRSDRKANGLCIMCGKPQCEKSTVYCLEHYIKNQRNNEKRKTGVPRSERMNYGLCYRCGKESMSGKKLCKSCYETSCSNLPQDLQGTEKYARWKQQNKLIFRK